MSNGWDERDLSPAISRSNCRGGSKGDQRDAHRIARAREKRRPAPLSAAQPISQVHTCRSTRVVIADSTARMDWRAVGRRADGLVGGELGCQLGRPVPTDEPNNHAYFAHTHNAKQIRWDMDRADRSRMLTWSLVAHSRGASSFPRLTAGGRPVDTRPTPLDSSGPAVNGSSERSHSLAIYRSIQRVCDGDSVGEGWLRCHPRLLSD